MSSKMDWKAKVNATKSSVLQAELLSPVVHLACLTKYIGKPSTFEGRNVQYLLKEWKI